MTLIESCNNTDFRQQQEFFDKNGYLFLKHVLPIEAIQEVEKTVESLFLSHRINDGETIHDIVYRMNQNEQELLYRLYRCLAKSFALDKLRLACEQYIQNLIPNKMLLDLAPGVLMGIPGDTRIIYDWHQELPYHDYLRDVVHVWIPLFNDTTIETGTMSFLVGSHKNGILEYKEREKTQPNSTKNLVVQHIDTLRKDFPEVFVEAKPTDLCIIDSCLVHRSNTNTSNITRFIASFRVAGINTTPSEI